MLFDIIVFVLTIYKATKVGYKVPLIQIVLRDGMFGYDHVRRQF